MNSFQFSSSFPALQKMSLNYKKESVKLPLRSAMQILKDFLTWKNTRTIQNYLQASK